MHAAATGRPDAESTLRMAQPAPAGHPRRSATDWIFIAKGIGIILVVIGHFDPVESPGYWVQMRSVIYTFHMPLFFVLSGYLYTHGKYAYPALIHNKVRRLVYPFLTMAAAFCVIKVVAGHFVRLDNPVNWQSLAAVFIDPVNSYAPPLWFLQALFLIFCLYPLARRVLGDGAILCLFVVLNGVFGSKYPVVGRVVANMPYFALGVWMRGGSGLAALAMGGGAREVMLTALAFVLGCVLQSAVNIFAPHAYPIQFALGVTGTLLVINASEAIADGGWRTGLLRIGYYSMTIYFLHSLFESAVRIGFGQFAHRISVPFLLVAALSVAAGVGVPIVLEKGIIRRSAIGRRYILGLE